MSGSPASLKRRSMKQTDRELLRELERGIPVSERPFLEIGERLGITEDEVISSISHFKDEGIIRKIRARINQRRIGINANALVAWSVPPDWDGFLRLSSLPGVSHCYLRKPVRGRWDYNVYTVHHNHERDEVYENVDSFARSEGITDFIVLFSTEEFKRVPAVRIDENGDGLI